VVATFKIVLIWWNWIFLAVDYNLALFVLTDRLSTLYRSEFKLWNWRNETSNS
jgi:hypothetical protein